MESSSVKRASGSPQAPCEFKDATSQSWTREQGSTAALVAMIASNVIMLLMLAA